MTLTNFQWISTKIEDLHKHFVEISNCDFFTASKSPSIYFSHLCLGNGKFPPGPIELQLCSQHGPSVGLKQ